MRRVTEASYLAPVSLFFMDQHTPGPVLCFIVALATDRAIGRNNDLPWRLPDDLKFFKKTTLGKPVMMGRKSYESLGQPLKNRLNIVISSRDLSLPEGVLQYRSLQEGIERMRRENTEEMFIIGGGQLFEQTLPLVQRLYLTRVDTVIPDADVFFPEIDFADWHLSWEERHEANEKHAHAFTFQRWDRKKEAGA